MRIEDLPRPYNSPLTWVAGILAILIGAVVVLSTPHDRFFGVPEEESADPPLQTPVSFVLDPPPKALDVSTGWTYIDP